MLVVDDYAATVICGEINLLATDRSSKAKVKLSFISGQLYFVDGAADLSTRDRFISAAVIYLWTSPVVVPAIKYKASSSPSCLALIQMHCSKLHHNQFKPRNNGLAIFFLKKREIVVA